MSYTRSKLKMIMSAIFIMLIVLGTSVVFSTTSFAATPHIQSCVSTQPITNNLSQKPLPSNVQVLTKGLTYYFNLASDTSNRFKSVSLFVKYPNSQTWC